MCTVNHLDNYLKKFNCMQGLIEIGKLSKKLHSSGKSFANLPIVINGTKHKQTMSQWGLSFFAYRLIFFSNDGKKKQLTLPDIVKAHGIYTELNVPLDTLEDIVSFFLRTSQEQFLYQQFHMPTIWARYLEIYNYDHFFSDIFYKLTGLSVEEYFRLGLIFSFYISQMEEPKINLSELITANYPVKTNDILTDQKIDRFLNLTAGTYETIRNEAERINNVILPGYEQYEFNPLMKYPIVKGDNRFSYYGSFQLVVPNLLLLDDKIARGIYWDLRSHYEQKTDKSERNKFLKKFGEAFEDYAHQVLVRYFGKENIWKVKDLIKDNNKNRQADLVAIEGDNVFIVECKSALVPLIARRTFLTSTISSWVRRNLAHAVTQLDMTENELKRCGFIGSKYVYKFILLHEELYISNAPLVKETLFANHLNTRSDANDINIISIYELEHMEQAIKKFGFSDILEIKSDAVRNPNGNFLSACRVLDNQIPIQNQYLESKFQKIVSDWASKQT